MTADVKLSDMHREQVRGLLEEADSIAKKAQDQGRNFTAQERVKVDELMGAVEQIKTDALRRQDIVNLGGVSTDGMGTPSKAAPFARKMLDEVQRRYSTKDIIGAGGVTIPVMDAGGVVMLGQRTRSLMSWLPWTQVGDTDQVSYLRETVRTFAAGQVDKGAVKPRSTLTVAKQTAKIATIAHLSEPINRADLADTAALSDYLSSVLALGVELAVEDEILHADGTGQKFLGLLEDTVQEQAFAVDPLTTARRAIGKLEGADLPVDDAAFLLHPTDWADVELLQDAEDRFYYGGPSNVGPPRLWGRQVVTSAALDAGTGLLVDRGSVAGWVREGLRVDWTESVPVPGDAPEDPWTSAFERNQLLFRAEGRWGFAVKRPSGVVKFELAASGGT